mgnify:CR=1 FL=1
MAKRSSLEQAIYDQLQQPKEKKQVTQKKENAVEAMMLENILNGKKHKRENKGEEGNV